MDISKRTEAFLNDFVGEYLQLPETERGPLFRLTEDVIVPEKLTGHVFEWATQYLSNHGCPALITHLVCAEVISRIEKVDFVPLRRHVLVEGEDEEQIEKTFLGAPPLSKMTFTTVDEVLRDWSNSGLPSCISNLEKHIVSSFAIKNTRRKMEDKSLIIPDLSPFTSRQDLQKTGLYGVFDGHGGSEAASYAASQLVFSLLNTNPSADLTETLCTALTSVDSDFLEKATREHTQCGSTGVVSLVTDSKIHLAWLGDTQAILVRSGRAIEVMSPHKPERPDEKERIEQEGGCVVYFGTWRVNGVLAVSRAIGDYTHRPHISGTPDTNTIQLNDDDEYFVIACDGLWDTVTPDECTELVYKHVVTNGKHKQDVAEMLVKEAKAAGSSDNISVIVIFLSSKLDKPQPAQNNEERVIINDKEGSDVGGGDNPTEQATDVLQTDQSAANNAEIGQTLHNTAYHPQFGTEVALHRSPIEKSEIDQSDSAKRAGDHPTFRGSRLSSALNIYPAFSSKLNSRLSRDQTVKQTIDNVLYKAYERCHSLRPQPSISRKSDGPLKTNRRIRHQEKVSRRLSSTSSSSHVSPAGIVLSRSRFSSRPKRVYVTPRSRGESHPHNSRNVSPAQSGSGKKIFTHKAAKQQSVRAELQRMKVNNRDKET